MDWMVGVFGTECGLNLAMAYVAFRKKQTRWVCAFMLLAVAALIAVVVFSKWE